MLQGLAGLLCHVNEAPFCCSNALYFEDQSHLRLSKKKKQKGRRRNRDAEEEDDSSDDHGEDYMYFDDGYTADLGMYRDLQVCTSATLLVFSHANAQRAAQEAGKARLEQELSAPYMEFVDKHVFLHRLYISMHNHFGYNQVGCRPIRRFFFR